MNTDPDLDPDPNQIQGFDDQKLGNIFAEIKKNDIFYQKLQFTYPLGLH